MKIYMILACLLVVGIVVYFIMRARPSSVTDEYFISTQSQSNDRITKLGLDKRSEDTAAILDEGRLNIPRTTDSLNVAEYMADPERDWIIELTRVDGGIFNRKELFEVFDYKWRSHLHSRIYGLSVQEKKWTFVLAGDSPDSYSHLQIAVDVQEVFNDENPDYNPQKLTRYLAELQVKTKKFASPVRMVQREPIESAIQKAKGLITTFNEFNYDAVIALHGQEPFDGLTLWDVLQSAGLIWGDGDLFHWNNTEGYGNDQHFSVWTMTEPGYFLPEEIRTGRMNPANLIFSFSIPRSADPQNVYDTMLDCARYCQKRLGGALFDKAGHPLDESKENQELHELVQRMMEKGFVPGSDKALRMF